MNYIHSNLLDDTPFFTPGSIINNGRNTEPLIACWDEWLEQAWYSYVVFPSNKQMQTI